MKLHITLCVATLLLVSPLFAQEIRYTDLATVTKASDNYTSYVSKDGAVYKIGDRLTIGKASAGTIFNYIFEGDGIVIAMKNLPAIASGKETEIKKIFVAGNKRVGYTVSFRTKGVTGLANFSILVENAIETGEIKSFGMTSDEALAELKKSKDKLDLGLITQKQYDSLKVALSKFIR
jgi:hypothetical protein